MVADGRYDRFYNTLVTPYLPGDTATIDEASLRKLASIYCQPESEDIGMGLIANPEAGEVFYLSRSEARRSVEVVVEEAAGRVPVFAGATHPTTEGTVARAVDAIEAGATGIFLMPPMGAMDVTFELDTVRHPEVWIDMIGAILAGTGPVPIIVHPLSGKWDPMFGAGIPTQVVLKMCQDIPEIIGWKMAYPYAAVRSMALALRGLDRHVAILPANGSYFHEYLLNGIVDGASTGCFNYSLEPMLAHIRAWRRGDLAEAQRIWRSGLYELQRYIFSDSSRLHVRFKIATWLRGHIPSPMMRAPMPPPIDAEITEIHRLLSALDLPVIELSGGRIGAVTPASVR